MIDTITIIVFIGMMIIFTILMLAIFMIAKESI